jgi:vacuolar-type H+-ATPase subunit I/STV1
MTVFRCDRGSTLWSVLIVGVLLAGLIAAMWPVYTGLKDQLRIATDELESAQGKIRELNKRPTQEELDIAKDRLAKTSTNLNQTATQLDTTSAQLEEMTARAKIAEKGLAEATSRVAELTSETEQLQILSSGLDQKASKLTTELKAITAKYENARRAASGKEDLLDRLDAVETKAAELENLLSEETKKLNAKSAACDELQQKLQAANADITEKAEVLSRLRKELADIPIAPLPDALAEEKYRDYLNQVATHTDRENRVAILFRSKLALAGSAYEAKADAAWRKEIRMKQVDNDRAAGLVYEEVKEKMRLHPDAHDQNVKLLQEAQEKVMGSKYERVIQQLIDREHELKAVGR